MMMVVVMMMMMMVVMVMVMGVLSGARSEAISSVGLTRVLVYRMRRLLYINISYYCYY